MKITILTLFPNLFSEVLSTSILDRAADKGMAEYDIIDIRKFGEGTHKSVDGRPFGGGPGMILKADILAKAWESVKPHFKKQKPYTILMSASGDTFKQNKAQEFSQLNHLIIICGHYEGVDQRFIDQYVDEETSIGDYVLTGGEIPAMVVIDATVRLIPNVLKKEEATAEESFSPAISGLLEYPQYTRPATFKGTPVPKVLTSGNHQDIKEWREKQSLEKTKKLRPDLLKS